MKLATDLLDTDLLQPVVEPRKTDGAETWQRVLDERVPDPTRDQQ